MYTIASMLISCDKTTAWLFTYTVDCTSVEKVRDCVWICVELYRNWTASRTPWESSTVHYVLFRKGSSLLKGATRSTHASTNFSTQMRSTVYADLSWVADETSTIASTKGRCKKHITRQFWCAMIVKCKVLPPCSSNATKKRVRINSQPAGSQHGQCLYRSAL